MELIHFEANSKNLQVKNVLGIAIMHFCVGIRQHFPFIIELFKTEKFFKDTGYKPDNLDLPSDFAKVNTKLYNLNSVSIKKDFGESCNSLLATR